MPTSRSRWLVPVGGMTLLAAAAAGLFGTTPGQAFLRVYAPVLANRPNGEIKPAAQLPASDFIVEAELIPWIDPGLVVDSEPPKGWTHLVIKNNVRVFNDAAGGEAPRAESGESWNELIGTFWLAMVADVRRLTEQPPRYGLERLGMGWCRTHRGHDVVLSTSTLRTQDVELSPVESLLLAMQELSCEQHMTIPARSSCTLFYDVERYLLIDGAHRSGVLRHAVLVHPQTGELTAFFWVVPPAGAPSSGELMVEQLPPRFVTTYDLHYQPGSGRLKGMPSESDYATVGLPECPERHAVRSDQRSSFLAAQLTTVTARELEAALRGFLEWQVVE